MQPKREPKVHTYSRKRRRRVFSPMRTVMSVCLTFAVAGAVGVVGYSIAKPILEMSGSREESFAEAPTAVTTVSAEAEMFYTENTIITETTEAAVPVSGEIQYAVQLPENALKSADALSVAVAAAKQQTPDLTAVVISMKIQGGAILYDTKIPLAEASGAAQGILTAEEIVRIVSENGCTAVASCSLLYDNLAPDGDAQTGYITESGSRWLDNKKENGGKPWINPFSETAKQYLSALVCEMAEAGFSEIWCNDVMFPPFRDSDLLYIGESVQNPDRGAALAALLNRLADDAGNVPVLLEIGAEEILDGSDEAFRPDDLAVSGAVIRYRDSEQADNVCRMLAQSAPDLRLQLFCQNGTIPSEQRTTLAEQYSGQLYGFATKQPITQ